MANNATNSKAPLGSIKRKHDVLLEPQDLRRGLKRKRNERSLFETLPTELKIEILDFLPAADVASVSSTNRLLYSQFRHRICGGIRVSNNMELWKLVRLLGVTLNYPSMGNFIKKVYLINHDDDPPRGMILPTVPFLRMEDFPMSKALGVIDSMKFRADKRSSWKKSIVEGKMATVVALLICMLPNLEKVHMGYIYAGEYKDLRIDLEPTRPGRRLSERNRLHPSRFERLRYISPDESWAMTFEEKILTLLGRSEAAALDNESSSGRPDSHEIRGSKLTSLTVSGYDSSFMFSICKTSKSLRKLHWNAHSTESGPLVKEYYPFTELLQPLAETLTELSVSPYHRVIWTRKSHINNWSEFVALKKLVITWLLVVVSSRENGFSMGDLPPNLEHLDLTEYGHPASEGGCTAEEISTKIQDWFNRGEAPLGTTLQRFDIHMPEQIVGTKSMRPESLTLPPHLRTRLDVEDVRQKDIQSGRRFVFRFHM